MYRKVRSTVTTSVTCVQKLPLTRSKYNSKLGKNNNYDLFTIRLTSYCTRCYRERGVHVQCTELRMSWGVVAGVHRVGAPKEKGACNLGAGRMRQVRT